MQSLYKWVEKTIKALYPLKEKVHILCERSIREIALVKETILVKHNIQSRNSESVTELKNTLDNSST